MSDNIKDDLQAEARKILNQIKEEVKALATTVGCCQYTDRRGRPVTESMDELTCKAHLGIWTEGACPNDTRDPDLPEFKEEHIPMLVKILEKIRYLSGMPEAGLSEPDVDI